MTHSMTSSARARIDGGISTPIARAVFWLITSRNLVGCWAECRRAMRPSASCRQALPPWHGARAKSYRSSPDTRKRPFPATRKLPEAGLPQQWAELFTEVEQQRRGKNVDAFCPLGTEGR